MIFNHYSKPPYFRHIKSNSDLGGREGLPQQYFLASLFYTRSLPKLCENLPQDLCQTVRGLCVWGNAGSPGSIITTSTCTNKKCCTIYPEYLYNDLSNDLFDAINTYSNKVIIKNVYSPGCSSFSPPSPSSLPLPNAAFPPASLPPSPNIPPKDDSSMCIPCVCYHNNPFGKGSEKYGENIYYVRDGDNQLYRCQPISPKGLQFADATGRQNSSYILNALVYNRITNTIISHKDLLGNAPGGIPIQNILSYLYNCFARGCHLLLFCITHTPE